MVAGHGSDEPARIAIADPVELGTLKHALPPLAMAAFLVAAWWLAVVETKSVFFPTPPQVVTATVELLRDGTIWDHIGASLFRVGMGFLLAVVVAIPLGLWMGWVKGAFATLNPIVQILRPISPIAWIPLAILWFGVGDVSPIFLIFLSSVFPTIVQTADRRAHDRPAIHLGRRQFRRWSLQALSPGRHPRGAAPDHRWNEGQSRRGLARRRRRRDDRAQLGARLSDHRLAAMPEIATTWWSPAWSSSESPGSCWMP